MKQYARLGLGRGGKVSTLQSAAEYQVAHSPVLNTSNVLPIERGCLLGQCGTHSSEQNQA